MTGALFSDGAHLRLNLATRREPSCRRSWMDVAGWLSSGPGQLPAAAGDAADGGAAELDAAAGLGAGSAAADGSGPADSTSGSITRLQAVCCAPARLKCVRLRPASRCAEGWHSSAWRHGGKDTKTVVTPGHWNEDHRH